MCIKLFFIDLEDTMPYKDAGITKHKYIPQKFLFVKVALVDEKFSILNNP